MIKFLSKLPLFKLVYRQGGIDSFALAQKDILDSMPDDLDKRANELIDSRLAELLSPIDHTHIATFNEKTKQYYIGSELADDAFLSNLKQEADMLKSFNLWKIIQETPKELAQRAMFVAGESVDDMKKGRSMLYTLDSQKRIVEMFSGYQQKNPL